MAIKIYENFCLKEYNTFGLDVSCSKYIEYTENEDIITFIKNNSDLFRGNFFILGNGSNVLFKEKHYDGVVIHPKTNDINGLKVAAAVNFDNLIHEFISSAVCGLENLSGIPGCVAASVVQNIGAYGSEVAEFIDNVEYIDLQTAKICRIDNHECEFSYRNSVFKNRLKNNALILSVTFKKQNEYKANLSYAALFDEFNCDADLHSLMNERITHEVRLDKNKKLAFKLRDFILDMRAKKIPDFHKFGNAGSFFKNPVISEQKLEKIINKNPNIKYFQTEDNNIKLAAGWLIDNCGLKGYEHNGAAIADNNALVLINKNNCSGKDIIALSTIVKQKIYEKFDVVLEEEVILV